jgi:hypothetical protein
MSAVDQEVSASRLADTRQAGGRAATLAGGAEAGTGGGGDGAWGLGIHHRAAARPERQPAVQVVPAVRQSGGTRRANWFSPVEVVPLSMAPPSAPTTTAGLVAPVEPTLPAAVPQLDRGCPSRWDPGEDHRRGRREDGLSGAGDGHGEASPTMIPMPSGMRPPRQPPGCRSCGSRIVRLLTNDGWRPV